MKSKKFHRLPTEEEIERRRQAREVVLRNMAAVLSVPIEQIGDDTTVSPDALAAINLELGSNFWPRLCEVTVGVLIHQIAFPI